MSKWKPGDAYVVKFSDESGELRTDDQLYAMVGEMKRIANNYGFDICSYGSGLAFKKGAISEALANIDLNEIIKDSAS